MENTKNVQLHEIIKNSLATYLSYKWSADKLYLKKRRKRDQKDENQRRKRAVSSVGRQRSVINLENNVFIYDAKNKTFTQLDLCDCFKNGMKYRKTDPFATKSIKKKYELCELQSNHPIDLEEYESYQLINTKDSVEHIFSNHMLKGGNWTKTLNNICPSKFDLFIQKELNKCTGKKFDVKSIKINTKHETSSSSNDKVCSSAAIGYYTITTYDDALQCGGNSINNSKGRKLSTKQCNFIGIREETVCPKKLYSKGQQCKLPSQLQKKERVSNDFGVQCFYAPGQHGTDKPKKDLSLEKPGTTNSPNKHVSVPRPRMMAPKELMKKKCGSLSDIFPTTKGGNTMQINSSAEIRRILNAQSDSSLSLSNTGEYFRNYMGPKPLLTYYQTSSTSKDQGGDTNDDRYTKNEPIIRMVEAKTTERYGTVGRIPVKSTSGQVSPICSIHCKKNKIVKNPCRCKYETAKKESEPLSFIEYRLPTVCSTRCIGPCAARKKSIGTITCVKDCPCPGQKKADKRDPTKECVCPPVPRKICCECNKASLYPACICDLLCNLRERIRKQTEEQNRNLDQILEELDKQDKEIQLIRRFVEKSKKSKVKNKCCTKKHPVCSCYTATVQYDFNGFPPAVTDKVHEKDIKDFLEDDFVKVERLEPEIIQLFGLENKPEPKNKNFEKESWKGIWKKNSRTICPNEFFKKKTNNSRKKYHSSFLGPGDSFQLKKNKKDKKEFRWFSKLVSSKKDLTKTAS